MGSSYVDYRGRGFWANDGTVELWLLQLIDAARPDLPTEAWLEQAIDHWQLQATAGFQGCVDVGLDAHLRGDPHREAAFVSIIDRLTEDLAHPADPPSSACPGDGIEPPADIRGLLLEVTVNVGGLVRGDPRRPVRA